MIKDKLYISLYDNDGLLVLSEKGAPLGSLIIAEWLHCELGWGEYINKLLSDALNPNDNECRYGANVYGWEIIAGEYVVIYNAFNDRIDVKEYVLLTLDQYVSLLRTYMAQLEQTKSKIKEGGDTKQYFEVEYFAEGARAKKIAHKLLNVDHEVFY